MYERIYAAEICASLAPQFVTTALPCSVSMTSRLTIGFSLRPMARRISEPKMPPTIADVGANS